MGEQRDLISIVVPVYNEEAAIGEDLDTVIETMEASGRDYEVIVVDDGSTDRSAEIVRQRPQVRLIQHPHNRGVLDEPDLRPPAHDLGASVGGAVVYHDDLVIPAAGLHGLQDSVQVLADGGLLVVDRDDDANQAPLLVHN